MDYVQLSPNIPKNPEFESQFYLQDNCEYYYVGLDICINRCKYESLVWEIDLMLEKIKKIVFPMNMSLTTMQNLVYALSLQHSTTIVDGWVFFSGNQYFNYYNISKNITFPRTLQYAPSTIIAKDIYQYSSTITKYIKHHEYNTNNIVDCALVMNHILEQNHPFDFNIILLQDAIVRQDDQILNIFRSIIKIPDKNSFVICNTLFYFQRKTKRWEKTLYQQNTSAPPEEQKNIFIMINKKMNFQIYSKDFGVFNSYKDAPYEKLGNILESLIQEVKTIIKDQSLVRQINKALDMNIG